MNALLGAISRALDAIGRSSGEEFAHGLEVYRLIEHPREEKGPAGSGLGEHDRMLRRAA